jgi:peptidoglycan L-alanyl-D-glutamate endopeptidase CwlK
MPLFSATSLSRLATCHPELQVLFHEVVRSFDCVVLEGFRDEAAQEAAFKAGNTKLHWPLGNHNQKPSLAVDVAPYPLDWKDTKRFIHFGGYVLGIASRLHAEGKMTYRIRWGGSWDGLGILNHGKMLNDYVHFELKK